LMFRGVPASLANSSGIFLGDSAHCDLARPGAALYGVNPTPGLANPMHNVVGKLCPLVGRISMDLICIDITDLPEGAARRGDEALFIGGGISLDDVAASAG